MPRILTHTPTQAGRSAPADRRALTRAWRLAFLLSADPDRARAIVGAGLARAPRFSALPRHRRDRLIILEARRASRTPAVGPSVLDRLRGWRRRIAAEHRVTRGEPDRMTQTRPDDTPVAPVSPVAMEALAALQLLPPQWREAWILCDLEGRSPMDASKSMDCSRSALTRHAAHAVEAMRATLGDRCETAASSLRCETGALEPVGFMLDGAGRSGRQRIRITLGVVIGVALAVVGAVLIVRALI